MKRYVALLMTAAVMFSLAACGTEKNNASGNQKLGQENSQNTEEVQESSASSQAADGKILIAYFTAAENRAV